jgi:aryl-alcohol dehydrogenase-like predicted oxidoreductase
VLLQVLGKGLKDLPRDKIVVATKVSNTAVANQQAGQQFKAL